MALGMFCGIPLPFHIWDEKLSSIMTASLPLVGLVIGALWWAAGFLLTFIDFPLLMAAAVLTAAPFFLTGFIHLDGYMDTSDAFFSRRPLEEKLRILKDPAAGAFAVIMLAVLFLLQFAAMYTITENKRYLAMFTAICVMSRCCSALSIFVMRHLPISGYSAMLGKNKHIKNRIFIIIIALIILTLSFLYADIIGLIVTITVILSYTAAIGIVYREFKGISGDLLGYSLVISELCGLIALALLQGLEVRLWF